MNKTIAVLMTAAFASMSAASYAADAADSTTATPPVISKDQAKKLNTQSTAEFKARGKVSEANEDLNKGDCKNSLDGAAKRACEKSATAQARSEKADAKTLHETEKKAINDASKSTKN